MTYNLNRELDRAAELLTTADSLLICAGAGMGVDSGLPDYRGDAGLWTKHAAFALAGIPYDQASSASTFFSEPALAWGIYSHKLAMYRRAKPHAGFDLLLRWTSLLPKPSFVFTSNIDGQFQKAGFEDKWLQECHGSIHWLQCSKQCTPTIWSARGLEPSHDPETLRWQGELPRCIYCPAVARPNTLMFHDANWLPGREMGQAERFKRWQAEVQRTVVIELGAGTDVPRVRNRSDNYAPRLIRINPKHHDIWGGGVALRAGALEALCALADRLTDEPPDA